MAVQPSLKSFLGVALETVEGTPVTATDYVPITINSFKPVDQINALYDNGIRGSMVENYAYLQGRKHSEVDFSGPVFADGVGYWLASLLGDVATTGASAPYTHTISLKNAVASAGDAQPKSLTLTDYYSAGTRQYAGQSVHDFSLNYTADGLLEYTAKSMGWVSNTTTAPTPAFSTVLPTQVWTGVVTIAGSTVAIVQSGSIAMARKTEAVFGIGNTQNPYSIFQGGLNVTGKMTLIMEDDAQLTNYLSNNQPALTFTWSTGTGAALTQVKFTTTKGAYTLAAIERSAQHVQVTVDFSAIGNTTDAGASAGYSSIKWELKNAKPSGTYQ
jgi:Phage tail tube protein